MGYSSDFELTVENSLLPIDSEDFHRILNEITKYDWDDWGDLCFFLQDARWHSHIEDIKKLCARFPDARIHVYAKEEDGEKWIVDGFAEKIDVRNGELVFEPRTLW